jgi:hypothetical protein
VTARGLLSEKEAIRSDKIESLEMRTLLTAAFSCSVLLPCAGEPIDFTPMSGQRIVEKIAFPQLVFHQDGHAITYEQPRNWAFSGSATQLNLTPDISQAQATIGQVALSESQVFDEATVAGLRQVVIESIPGDAKNAKVVAEEQSPVLINRQPSYSITANFRYYGQDYAISILFANLGKTQVRARLVARKMDFEALQRTFRGSLFSLRWQ